MITLPDRFFQKMTVDPGCGCWLWTARLRPDGYAELRFRLPGESWTYQLCHRLAYMAYRGPIPQELQCDHLCRKRHCVNPWHLELVTCRENLRRSPLVPAAVHRTKDACKRGHLFNEENTRWHNSHRYCRACNRLRNRTLYREANPVVRRVRTHKPD